MWIKREKISTICQYLLFRKNSSHPFRFISSALVMVRQAWSAGTLATHGPIISGLHRISSLNPTLCWTRVEDIICFIIGILHLHCQINLFNGKQKCANISLDWNHEWRTPCAKSQLKVSYLRNTRTEFCCILKFPY